MSSKTLIIGNGFIGSAIASEIDGDIIDIKINRNYNTLTKEELAKYDNIILTAGHSSIHRCFDEPIEAWHNNVTNFIDLLSKIDNQKLIYASSGGVYNGAKDHTENNTEYNLTNIYDLTKHTIDGIALLSGKRIYGLRFGAVCGYSPNFRNDIMINKMYVDDPIVVSHPEIIRPILGIKDLVRAVKIIIENDRTPGIYNLASFTLSVGEIAERISELTGKKVIRKDSDKSLTHSYNFDMDATKFKKEFNFEFRETLESIMESLNENIGH